MENYIDDYKDVCIYVHDGEFHISMEGDPVEIGDLLLTGYRDLVSREQIPLSTAIDNIADAFCGLMEKENHMKEIKSAIYIVSDGDIVSFRSTGKARDIANNMVDALVDFAKKGSLSGPVVKSALVSAFCQLEDAGI